LFAAQVQESVTGRLKCVNWPDMATCRSLSTHINLQLLNANIYTTQL